MKCSLLRWPLALSMLLTAPLATHAALVLQPDAGPPGAGLVVSIVKSDGGFTGNEVVTTSCPDDIIVGPGWLSNGAGNTAAPIGNAVLSTVFFILENAVPADCNVLIDGQQLSNAGALDNVFSIVAPQPGPVDGGVGDLDGVANGVIVVASTARSDGGVVVYDNLNIPAGVRMVFDTSDPIAATGGNESLMPIIVEVRGDAVINGIVDASGSPGRDYGDNALARSLGDQSIVDGGDGGHGGPGGGGGGAGGPHNASSSGTGGYSGTGGDGFGGGSGSPSVVGTQAPGGAGVAYAPSGVTGGNSPFDSGGGLPSGCNTCGGGGGSGNPFGTGGTGATASATGGPSGYGGGGGAATANSTNSGGGGGGFATAGQSGGAGQSNGGRGGRLNGLAPLLPLMGGSGGGGGDGWITGSGLHEGHFGGGGGGGGGGAFMFIAFGELSGSGVLLANGGVGGEAGTGNCAASGGGGGSGGGILLAARALTFTGEVQVHGGNAGDNAACAVNRNRGGDGGEGRVRFDGAAPPALTTGPTSTTGSVWQGCAVSNRVDAAITLASDTTCNYGAIDNAGDVVATGNVAAGGTVNLAATRDQYGPLTVIFSRDGVPSSVGITRIVAETDSDGIPDFADADSDNDSLTDIVELGGVDHSGDVNNNTIVDWQDAAIQPCPDSSPNDGLCDMLPTTIDFDQDGIPDHLDLDSDQDGIPDVVENAGLAFDLDGDGRGDDTVDNDFDGIVASFDIDDGDAQQTGSLMGERNTDDAQSGDFRDLDADGDGIWDISEAGGVDSNNDGRVDDETDADTDGLSAVVDPSEGGSALPTDDTDLDGAPDFQDVCGDGQITGTETCDLGPANGTCQCSAETCTMPLAGAACEDGEFCTQGDSCDGAGSCIVGSEDPCSANALFCDEDNDECDQCRVADDCAEPGNCLDATCEGTGVCGAVQADAGSSCVDTDDSLCTAGRCDEGGMCIATDTALDCSVPPDKCHVSGLCADATGECAYDHIGCDVDIIYAPVYHGGTVAGHIRCQKAGTTVVCDDEDDGNGGRQLTIYADGGICAAP